MSEQPTTYEVPQFVTNIIGRLLLENEALRQGMIPQNSVADEISVEQ